MIPEHYILILLGGLIGVMIGVTLGGVIVGLMTARKLRRVSADEWLAAQKYYTAKNPHVAP